MLCNLLTLITFLLHGIVEILSILLTSTHWSRVKRVIWYPLDTANYIHDCTCSLKNERKLVGKVTWRALANNTICIQTWWYDYLMVWYEEHHYCITTWRWYIKGCLTQEILDVSWSGLPWNGSDHTLLWYINTWLNYEC